MAVIEFGAKGSSSTPKGVNRGLAVMDFILRIVAIIATLASAISMGTTRETLPFFTRFMRFRAVYKDIPTLTFFVVANAIVTAYLVLSLAISIFNITKSRAQNSRVVLIILDTGAMALLTAAGAASAAIVYLAHKGNTSTNWFPFCQQFNSFCQRTSGSLIGTFGGVVVLILLILLSAVSLSRR